MPQARDAAMIRAYRFSVELTYGRDHRNWKGYPYDGMATIFPQKRSDHVLPDNLFMDDTTAAADGSVRAQCRDRAHCGYGR